MPRAAVLGSPIAHSLSPVLHNAGYAALGLDDWSYERFETTAEELPERVGESESDFRGFSVTMPGKFAALNFATEVTDRARLMGSANTLVRLEGGGWRADNTDTEGIAGALAELMGATPGTGRRALVIGAGGTARPALWGLAQRGYRDIDVLNRRDRTAEFAKLADALELNLTPVSYADNLRARVKQADVIVSTVPSAVLTDHLEALSHAPVLDVIYDTLPTPLMAYAAADGYPTVGGHIMLAHQSFSQFEQYTGLPAPREAMVDALLEALKKRD